jgi:hypothetical protein
MELIPKGYILYANSELYFQNPFVFENLHDDSRNILQKALKVVLKDNQEKIDSIYVRGSFASNTQVNNYSDIDLIIIHQGSLESLPKTLHWKNQTFRLDLDLLPFERIQDLENKFGTLFLLKTQSICLWGNNRMPEIQEFEVNKDTASKFGRNIPQLIEKAKISILEDSSQLLGRTQWIARALIRASNALFLDKAKIYTRDLVYCYRYMSQYYPQYESQMRILVEQAIQPTFNQEELFEFLDDFGMKLSQEIDQYFMPMK